MPKKPAPKSRTPRRGALFKFGGRLWQRDGTEPRGLASIREPAAMRDIANRWVEALVKVEPQRAGLFRSRAFKDAAEAIIKDGTTVPRRLASLVNTLSREDDERLSGYAGAAVQRELKRRADVARVSAAAKHVRAAARELTQNARSSGPDWRLVPPYTAAAVKTLYVDDALPIALASLAEALNTFAKRLTDENTHASVLGLDAGLVGKRGPGVKDSKRATVGFRARQIRQLLPQGQRGISGLIASLLTAAGFRASRQRVRGALRWTESERV